MIHNKIYLIIIFIIIGIILGILVLKKQSLISSEGIKGTCKLLEIKRLTKGLTQRQTRAIIEYYVNGDTFTKSLPAFPHIQIGECFEIYYVPSSPEIVEVDFSVVVNCDSVEIDPN